MDNVTCGLVLERYISETKSQVYAARYIFTRLQTFGEISVIKVATYIHYYIDMYLNQVRLIHIPWSDGSPEHAGDIF